MTLSGLLVTHQCEEFDYCYEQALKSLIHTCDEVIVVDGRSTDGTREKLRTYENKYVKVIDADWNPIPNTNGQWLADLYNLAKSHASGFFNIGLQADEVLHEWDRSLIRSWTHNTSLRRINFWRDAQHFVPMGKVCGSRVFRFGSDAKFVGDAEQRDTDAPRSESDVCVFHYGFLRKTEALISKGVSLENSVFGRHNPLFEKMEIEGRTPFDNYHANLETYTGPHPEVAHEWLDDRGYNSGKYIAARSIADFIKPEWTGVEIGVFVGDSSRLMLSRCRRMYLIDPCTKYDGNPDNDYIANSEYFVKRMRNLSDRFTFIQGMSNEVHDQVPEVDFAFIDGNHTFEYVQRDIALYWPKIRTGGFLSGHDYGDGFPGVVAAVHQFAERNHLPIEIHADCWLIRKP